MEGFQLLKSVISDYNCVTLSKFIDRKTNKMDDDSFLFREVQHISIDEMVPTLSKEIRKYFSPIKGCFNSLNIMVQRYKKDYVLPLHQDNEGRAFPSLKKIVTLNVLGEAIFQIEDTKHTVNQGDVVIMDGPSANAVHGVPQTLSERNNIVIRHILGRCPSYIASIDLEELLEREQRKEI